MKLNADDFSVDFESRRWQLGFYGMAGGQMAHVILKLDPAPEEDDDKGLNVELYPGVVGKDLISRFELAPDVLTLHMTDQSATQVTLSDKWTALPVIIEQFSEKAGVAFSKV